MTLDKLPSEILFSLRDTVSAALGCAMTFLDKDGNPIEKEKFLIQRRYISRVCQNYHCFENSPIKKRICDKWDQEASKAIFTTKSIYETNCDLGFWCIGIPIVFHGDVINILEAGEVWNKDYNNQIEEYINKGIQFLKQDDLTFDEKTYSEEFKRNTLTPFSKSSIEINRIKEELLLIKRLIEDLLLFWEDNKLPSHTSMDVLNSSSVFRKILNNVLKDYNEKDVKVLLEIFLSSSSFSNQWLREFVDPSVLNPDNSKRRSKECFVFFADIRGFTKACSNFGNEKVNELRTLLLSKASEILISGGAVIDKYMGDAILAYFFPDELPDIQRFEAYLINTRENDFIEKLLLTVTQIQKLSEELTYNEESQKYTLKFGIGLSHGSIYYGHHMYRFKQGCRREVTGIGDAINIAARLCSLAGRWGEINSLKYGSKSPILLDQSASKKVSSSKRFICQKVDEARLKGINNDDYSSIYAIFPKENTQPLEDIKRIINMQLGFLSSPPQYVIDAFQDYYEDLRHGKGLNIVSQNSQNNLPKDIGDLISCSPANITFRESTTQCIEAAIESVHHYLEKNNHDNYDNLIIYTDFDHPTVEYCSEIYSVDKKVINFKKNEKSTINKNTILKITSEFFNKIENNPKILILPHVTWETGIIFPYIDVVDIIENIFKQKKKPFPFVIIDGAHALGHVPIKLQTSERTPPQFHFYATCTHKWFRGPHGVGVLYVSEEVINKVDIIKNLAWGETFTCESGLSTRYPIPKHINNPQFRTHDRAKAYATHISIKKYMENNRKHEEQNKFDYIKDVRNKLKKELLKNKKIKLPLCSPGDDLCSGILSIKIKGFKKNDCLDLKELLEQNNILVDFLSTDKGLLRFCVGYELINSDIVYIVNTVNKLLKRIKNKK